MTSRPLLAFEHVSREFDSGRIVALKDVNLEIAKGESLSIVGASGSGKTTLIMLMCGIMAPSAGVIRWNGETVTTAQEWTTLRRSEIGIVFQDFNLFPTLSAIENVEVATFGTGIGGEERIRRAEAALDAVGLSARSTHLPHQLSGGERQRAAVARALVTQPKLVLADEPTGNLDGKNAEQVFELMLELNRERRTSLVVVTHDLRIAGRMDRALEISNGSLREVDASGR